MQKRQILINAIMSVAQVVITGIVLFVLYRFLLNIIGIEQLGIWSVVLATTSVTNIANLGLSASVVKFVAKYLARDEEKTVADVIQTSAISIGILIGLVLLLAYPFASWLLSLIIPGANLRDALSILPYALLSLWIMVVASVFLAGLDGYQRIDIRSKILIVSAIFNLILCFILVPTYGLMGLAYAHIAQVIIILIGSWFLLKRCLPLLPVIPFQWNRKLFKEMVGYGLNFQAISVSQMLYDPITKGLLTRFGGLAMTGFYEMASRMILQVRALLVSANQVLVPTIADLQEKDPKIIQKVYKDSYNLLFYIALLLFSIFIALAPVISQLWIGEYESIFVIFSTVLALGWFLNTLTAPAYFANLGIGELCWNTIGHVMIAVLNLGLGLLLGSIHGGIGVVFAWVISLIIGSSIIAVSYHHRYGISMMELLPKESVSMTLAVICASGASIAFYYGLNGMLPSLTMAVIPVVIFLGIVFVPLWLHPMRKRLTGWIDDELLNRKTEIQ